MASTATVPSVFPSSSAASHESGETAKSPGASHHHTVLLAIQSAVLLTGAVSLSLTLYMMKFRVTSSTSVAVLNLIFAHLLFLATVPFRIYYHATGHWDLGQGLCRVTSGMIHIHMYMSFIFYVIILVTRLTTFYCKRELSFNRTHTLLVSMAVWVVVLVAFPCVMFFLYVNRDPKDKKDCFKFGKNIQNTGLEFNYITITVITVASTALTVLQANAVRVLYKKCQSSDSFHQDLRAHLINLYLTGIMMACFVPYHIFRLIYMTHLELEDVNEVFLNLTAFNCLDILALFGNRWCSICLMGKNV